MTITFGCAEKAESVGQRAKSKKASRRSMAVGERSGGRELPAKCVSDLEKELAISHE